MSQIKASTRAIYIIGDPALHSLSPAMHNAAYEELGMSAEYVYLAASIKAAALSAGVDALRTLDILGFAVTHPHKIAIVKLLDRCDEAAQEIGAVNTVVNNAGKLVGFNTDYIGVVRALEERGVIKGKSAVILGAGGAARAACFGLIKAGVEVTVLNRTIDRAKELALRFGAQYGGLEEFSKKRFDIIINSTPIGMGTKSKDTIVPEGAILSGQVVFDMVYQPTITPLLRQANRAGATVVPGHKMLLHQAIEQFKIFTGREAPSERMNRVMLSHLGEA